MVSSSGSYYHINSTFVWLFTMRIKYMKCIDGYCWDKQPPQMLHPEQSMIQMILNEIKFIEVEILPTNPYGYRWQWPKDLLLFY